MVAGCNETGLYQQRFDHRSRQSRWRGRQPLIDGSASDFDPDWSPHGERIAYAHNAGDHENSDIWVMEPSGASKEALTHMKGSEHRPAWSPGGKEIAFVSTETGIGQIYVLDLQDRAVRQLTQDRCGRRTCPGLRTAVASSMWQIPKTKPTATGIFS